MAGVDCLRAMIFFAMLLFTAVHAQGASNKERHLLASGKQKQGISSRIRSPSMASELLVPVQSVVYRSLASREPFETCGGCRCCSKSNSNRSSNCIQTQCCFGIKCNLPGKPFGVCSFSPQTCGCGIKCNLPGKP